MKKGQISLEVVFSVGVVLFLAVIIIVFAFVKKNEIIQTEQFTQARAECLKISDALGSLLTLGSDSNITFRLYYLHNIYNNSIIRSYSNTTDSPLQEIAVCNYVGSTGPYWNVSSSVTVWSRNGNVSVSWS